MADPARDTALSELVARVRLTCAGRVGVPKDGERVCWQCKGAGKTGPGPFDGCDRCAGTGVLKARKPKLTALEAAGQ